MAHSYHAGGGKTPGTYTAGNTTKQGITYKYSPIKQVKYSMKLIQALGKLIHRNR